MLSAALFLVVCGAFLRRPKATVAVILVVFVFQDLAVALVGGRRSAIGAALQNADEICTVALLACTIGVAVVRQRTPRLSTWVLWYGAFVLTALVSTGREHAGWMRAAVGILVLSKGFVLAWVAEQFRWTTDDATRILRGLTRAGYVVLACAVPWIAAPVAFRDALGFEAPIDYRYGFPSVGSLMGHPNGFGWLMAVAALVAVGGVLSGQRGAAWRVALFLGGMSLSFRRKPLLGVLVASVVVILTVRGNLRPWQRAAVLVAIAVLAVPLGAFFLPILLEGYHTYFGPEAVATQARSALYAGSVSLAQQHFPFGVGVGRFGSYGSVAEYSELYFRLGYSRIYGMSPEYSAFIQDTFWPQILGETGIAGLVAYAGAMVALTAGAWRAAARWPLGRPHPLVLAAPLIAIETLIESAAAPAYTTPMQGFLALGLPAVAAWLVAEAPSPAAAPVARPLAVERQPGELDRVVQIAGAEAPGLQR